MGGISRVGTPTAGFAGGGGGGHGAPLDFADLILIFAIANAHVSTNQVYMEYSHFRPCFV